MTQEKFLSLTATSVVKLQDISNMSYNDLDEVLEIERATSTPWTRGQMEAELKTDIGWQFVYRLSADSTIGGFITGTLTAGEAEIRKLAVASKFRRRQIASQLLEYSLLFFETNKAECCYLEVRESNTAARNLYLKYGFQIVGRRKNYYHSPQEDAIMMSKVLLSGGSL